MGYTNEYNTVTGQKLNQGQSYVNAQGQNVTQGTNVNIPVSSIVPTTPIPLASNVLPPPSTALVNTDLQMGFDIASANVEALNKEGTDTSSNISSLLASLGDKGTDTQQVYKDTGVTDLYNQVSDLNAQAKGLNLEAQAIPIQTQQRNANTGATDRGVAPQTTGALRENALKALSLGQQYAIASGNYDKAKNYADQIVDAKYDQIEADIKAKQANLEALDKYQLTPAQEKRKDAQKALLDKQAQDVADKRENDKTIESMIIDATAQSAPASILASAQEMAKKGATPVQVAVALGQYSGAAAKAELLKQQIITEKKQQANLQSQINERGRSTTSDKTKIVKINGQDYIQNADGTFSTPSLPTTNTSVGGQQILKDKISNIDKLVTSGGLKGAVGPTGLARNSGLVRTAARQDFIAGVKQITSDLTLDKLIAAKAAGATFGALSEGELGILAGAATKIGTWEIKDKNGKVTGYAASESSFKKELNTIKELTSRGLASTPESSYLDTVDSAHATGTVISPDQYYNSYITP